jgi:hypothetical protein
MLRILGRPRTLCDGLTRRDLLQVGAIGALSLADLLRGRAASAASTRRALGRAKACILLFPYGSPPQHETFDPKPDAPSEIQGELKAMATRVDGLRICDQLPRIAQVMDRVTVVRSVTHDYPLHGVAYALTGIPTYTPALENRSRDAAHWPFIGSVVDYLDERRGGAALPPLPRNVGLPWVLNSKTDNDVSAGTYAAFLGQAYDPVCPVFDGPGLKLSPRYTEGQPKQFMDPFAATTAEGRFRLGGAATDTTSISPERLGLRRSLLRQFDSGRHQIEAAGEAGAFDAFQERAFSLLLTPRMREALDIGREAPALRERYGMNLFGQSCLAARRLVEAGGRFVSVFWDGYGQFAGCAWDTHAYHYPRLKEYLLPGFDRAYSALIQDLDDRGLLDDTLVLWMSEHGRTPQIDSKPQGAGRHHWSRAYSIAMAGGGTHRGAVVGRTDALGGEVEETPISPKDILATTYHLLGIDAETMVPDRLGRPVPIAGEGRVRSELIA